MGGCVATNVRVLGRRAAVQCYSHLQEMGLHIVGKDQTGRDAREGEAIHAICYEGKGIWSSDPLGRLRSPCSHHQTLE